MPDEHDAERKRAVENLEENREITGEVFRRTFLQASILAFLAGNVLRAGNWEADDDSYSLNQARIELDSKVDGLSKYISVNTDSFSQFGNGIRPNIEKDTISKALLYMSYLDSGDAGVEKLIEMIKKMGLEVSQNAVLGIYDTFALDPAPIFASDNTLKLFISSDFVKGYWMNPVNYESNMLNALMQFVQISKSKRTSSYLRAIKAATVVGSTGVSYSVINTVFERRTFLGGVVRAAISVIPGIAIANVVAPDNLKNTLNYGEKLPFATIPGMKSLPEMKFITFSEPTQ